jgi:serine/threonine protein kinase
VYDDHTGETCGFLMPLAPDQFLWDRGIRVGRSRTLDWVTTTEDVWQLNQVDLSEVTATDRLFLMAQLVYAIAWLHMQGWVFGDLSYGNIAFAMYPQAPRVLIFDCDDALELADPQRGKQPQTPYWIAPECLVDPDLLQDPVTDVYKLGLAVVRCLKPGKGTTTTYDVGRLDDILDAEGMALLTRTLSDDPARRPLAKELFTYLNQVATPRMVPPLIERAELVTPLLPPGSNARIHWRIEGAEQVNVYFGENPEELVRTVIPARAEGQCAFPVTRPGQVTVEASNRYGTRRLVIGDVA